MKRIVELDPEEVRAWERMGEILCQFPWVIRKPHWKSTAQSIKSSHNPTVLANIKSLEEDVAAENRKPMRGFEPPTY